MIVGSERPTPILTVQSLAAGYGSDWVVRHVSVQAGRGEIVTIIGPNGSGKSTLLKAVMGLVPSVEGSIVLDGVEMSAMRAEIRARSGIAYVPQERAEHLALLGHVGDPAARSDLGRHPAQVDAVENDSALDARHEAHHRLQQRALA